MYLQYGVLYLILTRPKFAVWHKHSQNVRMQNVRQQNMRPGKVLGTTDAGRQMS